MSSVALFVGASAVGMLSGGFIISRLLWERGRSPRRSEALSDYHFSVAQRHIAEIEASIARQMNEIFDYSNARALSSSDHRMLRKDTTRIPRGIRREAARLHRELRELEQAL